MKELILCQVRITRLSKIERAKKYKELLQIYIGRMLKGMHKIH